jgi:hypothetical protein
MLGLSEKSIAKGQRLYEDGQVREVTPTRTFARAGRPRNVPRHGRRRRCQLQLPRLRAVLAR